jgi:hypothetical protein
MLGCVDLCLSDLVIPNKVDGYDVIGIDNFAFENNQLTTVSIPDSVDFIGFYAFGNNQLTTVHIPNSVSFIENNAFSDNQLTSVHLSNSLASIEGGTFSNNQLTSLTIPNSVSGIGRGAFENNQLTSVTIPNNVTMILESAFASNQLTSVSIPNSISVIREKTFENNQLTSVAISNSVTAIDAQAFANNQLTEVTIPYSVTKIGAQAFENNQLENISFSGNRPEMSNERVVWESFGDGAFIGDGAEMVGNTFMFPSTAREWAGFANDNPDIYPLSFPDGGTISFTAFSEQPVNVKFKFEFRPWPDVNPDFETALIEVNGACASYSVDFPSQGDNTYSSFLMFVVERDIPVTVENVVINGDAPTCNGDNNNIVYNSFMGNPIQNIHYCLGASDWPGEPVEGITPELDESCEYSPPQESHFTYNIMDEGIEITGCVDECPSDLVIPEEIDGYVVTRIGEAAFEDNHLASVVIPDGVTDIGGGAFAYNELSNLVLPYSVNLIGAYAFHSNQLSMIAIPDGISSILAGSFSENQLTSVSLPNSVDYIDAAAFRANQLANISIPDGVFYIGESAFADNQLTTLTIPSSVEIIGDGAFDFNQLTSVTIPESVTSIGGVAFHGNQLTSVTIGNSVTSIGDGAFAANQLTSITIPKSVSYIGINAFEYNQLSSLIFFGEPPTIGNNAFASNSLTSITYCQDGAGYHGEWSNIVIEGITPSYDADCNTSEDIQYAALDLDQNGSFEALTDALILLRYAFGLRGDNLISDAVALDANRTTAEDIEAHIQSLLP